jgi:hypothetical protein
MNLYSETGLIDILINILFPSRVPWHFAQFTAVAIQAAGIVALFQSHDSNIRNMANNGEGGKPPGDTLM